MTQAIGMAPGLTSLVMYIGSTDTAIISAMTTHNPLPTTIGCSWGWTPVDPKTLDPYFQRMAAQGQNFFRGVRRLFHLDGDRKRALGRRRSVYRFGRRHGLDYRRRGWRLGIGNRVGRQRRRHLAGQDRDSRRGSSSRA